MFYYFNWVSATLDSFEVLKCVHREVLNQKCMYDQQCKLNFIVFNFRLNKKTILMSYDIKVEQKGILSDIYEDAYNMV